MPPTVRGPVAISLAVVERDGHLLLTRRPEGAVLAGSWEFPGGKVEPGEHPRDAARRECREELGFDVIVKDLVAVASHVYADPGLHVLLLAYRAIPSAGADVDAALGSREHAWVRPRDLGRYPLPPANADILQALGVG